LFARLLQYRAFKQVAALFSELEAGALRRYPRSVALDDRYAGLLPEVMIGVSPARFAEIAATVFRPKPPPMVSLDHLHIPTVSVREHADLLRVRLAESGVATFHTLVADCEHTREVVARFLALLELYREALIAFEQVDPLGELHVRWMGERGYQPDVDADSQDTANPETAALEEGEYG
jgi:segregation and condensation protein A